MATTFEHMGLTKKNLLIMAIMVFGGFITVLNVTLLTPALPSIMTEMNVSASTAQWLTTGALMVSGIMIPISAFLLDKFTTRKLFFFAMGLFTFGSLIVAISSNFGIVLFGRACQAAGGGIMMPMGQVLMLLILPKQYRGTGMGIIGIVFGVAPCVGPVIAGLVIDAFNWHVLFYGLVVLALLIIILSFFVLDNFGEPKDVHLDILSVILSTLGFGGLLYSFSAIGSSGFSTSVIVSLAVGAVTLAMFIYRQLHMETPLLRMDILANRTFAISVILTMLVNAAVIVGGILMPIYIQTIRGFSATTSSLIMLPAALISAFMSPISGRLFDKYGARTLAVPGLLVTILATICLTRLNDGTPLFYIGFVYCFRMFGLALVNMPLNTWGLNALDNSVMAHGTAIGNTFRNVAGSLGTAILVTVMSISIALAPDPSSGVTQIAGINYAFTGATIMMVIAFVLAFLFVKVEK